MRYLGAELSETITDVEDRIAYARVAEMAERYMQVYQAGEIARVDVAYTRFYSVGVQRPQVAQLLPIEPPRAEEGEPRRPGRRPDFEFSPPPDVLLGRLIPETVKARLYQYFNDAILSEQVARMVAMKAATDAAGDMIKYLTRQYNRARQTQITLELADIVGGSEALK
jgi:F-type H+-transporting ATPase subunit gamma